MTSSTGAVESSSQTGGWPEPATLADCLDTLGPQALHALHLPDSGAIAVSSVVVSGIGEAVPETPGGLLLAVGEQPGTEQTAETIRRAADSHCAAIVIKEYARDVAALQPVAAEAGIALLVTPDDMPWRHLDSLYTAAASSTLPPSPRYPAVGIGDLFALANAIASSVGGATTIEDPHGQVLAYSNVAGQEIDERRKLAILGRQTPERHGNTEEYHEIFRAEGKAVRFELPETPEVTPRLAAAVRAGTEGIGVIFVLDGTPPLGPHASSALQDAARITAVHLLRSRTARDPERQERAEAMRAVLDGAASSRVVAGRLGMPIDAPMAVIAIAPRQSDVVPAAATARIVDLASLHCSAWHRDALCTAVGDTVYALLPVGEDPEPQARLRRFATEISASLERSAGLDISVGIGPVADGLDQVPGARHWADRVLHALAAEGSERSVADVDDVRSVVTLVELAARDAGELDMIPGPVDAICAYDAEHGTPYAETLLAFLDAFGDASKAAVELSIHENTLRYRIRRLQELFSITLSDPDERLVAWLRLRIRALRGVVD